MEFIGGMSGAGAGSAPEVVAFVTGFGRFGTVTDNPTMHLAQDLQSVMEQGALHTQLRLARVEVRGCGKGGQHAEAGRAA